MKRNLLFSLSILLALGSNEQVTQINANKALSGVTVLNTTLVIFKSEIDSSIWVSDGTLAGTVQISDTIKYAGYGALLNGKFIFKGWSPNCGNEIFITDGTAGGTKLVKDINPGVAASQPALSVSTNNETTMAILGNYIYFPAVTPTEGCELWKTDGTAANTSLVKDIVAGTASGIDSNFFEITSTGTVLLFKAQTATTGHELWSSTGTAASTNLLKDIDAGTASANPRVFNRFNNIFLFTVTSSDGATTEIWRTDGTAAGTVRIKDQILPMGLANYNSNAFHIFKSKAYFLIHDGVHSGDALYSTDGVDATSTHTAFIKDLGTATPTSFLLANAVNLPDKFIFSYSDESTIFTLMQSDGTTAGTTIFKSFPVNSGGKPPFIYSAATFDANSQTIVNPRYDGKFYFVASDANGYELWSSDGTTTTMVKDINPGAGDGIGITGNWLFTQQGLFFEGMNGTNGNELWKTDGTTTAMVQDIYPGANNFNPELYFINNGKVFFSANDGNPAVNNDWDLYVVNGTFRALPVQLLDFTVVPKGNNALLQWSTAQEINSRDFTVQSSADQQNWKDLGTVAAKGNSTVKNQYSFTDFGVMNSGNKIVYYRLIQNDLDGNQKYSDIITLRIQNSPEWNVQLFSNPVYSELKVLLSGSNERTSLSILDPTGKEMYRKQVDQNGMISMPLNLQSGVYILHATSGKKTKSLKFVKE